MVIFEKSEERSALEKQIIESLRQSQKDALAWCIKHPLRGIPAFVSLMRTGTIPDEISHILRDFPSSIAYQEAYSMLEELERDEGFPAMRAYAERLDHVREALPEENRKNGYYIYAGIDFYWARLFDRTMFEDVAYSSEFSPHMWWEPERYQRESLHQCIATLREAGALSESDNVGLQISDSSETRLVNDYNKPEWTLIEKSGHDILQFLRDRFGHPELVHFGAIIVASPVRDEEKLIQGMQEFGYSHAHTEQGELILAPYTMGVRDIRVFLKEDYEKTLR